MKKRSYVLLVIEICGALVLAYGAWQLMFVAMFPITEYPPSYYVYPAVFIGVGLALMISGPKLVSRIRS